MIIVGRRNRIFDATSSNVVAKYTKNIIACVRSAVRSRKNIVETRRGAVGIEGSSVWRSLSLSLKDSSSKFWCGIFEDMMLLFSKTQSVVPWIRKIQCSKTSPRWVVGGKGSSWDSTVRLVAKCYVKTMSVSQLTSSDKARLKVTIAYDKNRGLVLLSKLIIYVGGEKRKACTVTPSDPCNVRWLCIGLEAEG